MKTEFGNELRNQCMGLDILVKLHGMVFVAAALEFQRGLQAQNCWRPSGLDSHPEVECLWNSILPPSPRKKKNFGSTCGPSKAMSQDFFSAAAPVFWTIFPGEIWRFQLHNFFMERRAATKRYYCRWPFQFNVIYSVEFNDCSWGFHRGG